MGNPTVRLNNTAVMVNGFFFNVAMTVFHQEWDKRAAQFPAGHVAAKLAQTIKDDGYDVVMDTALHLDPFVATAEARRELANYLGQLRDIAVTPGYQLPEEWQKLLRGEVGGSSPIPITREHYLELAYVLQIIIDLIEGRIAGEYVERVRLPADWSPSGSARPG